MRMKRNTLIVFLVIFFIVAGTIISYRLVSASQVERFLNERNEFCANLTIALNGQEGVEDCYCYFQGFKTDNPELDDKTLPLCACECFVNGTRVKVGLLEPKSLL